jgi:hypothetical protein
MHTMNHITTSIQDRLAMEALLRDHKPGDYLVLADAILNSALDGTRPLRQSEWEALLDSPLTLGRMRVLEARRQGASKPAAVTMQASNDDVLRPSHWVLRAAADVSDGSFSQSSEDGSWMLYAETTGSKTELVLKLQAQSEHADKWMAKRPTVQVLDGAGNELLTGELDKHGEVRGPFMYGTDLRSHLAAHGHRMNVKEVKEVQKP